MRKLGAALQAAFFFALPSVLAAQISSSMVAVKGNIAPEVQAQRLSALGATDPGKTLTLEIQFVPRNRTEVQKLLADQQDPSSPSYHKWLIPQGYTQRFGPTEADYNGVNKWL